ncbi:NYN domain-containing protein [Gordonia phosphorivorans]|uniref:NYN domain-containing protein n=1 Tax=Gordonia phosphorivorans TaxID=1056982 RepID=A0ABV6HAN3_9ACTN
MRSTCSLYIDTGYLLASAARRVTGTSLRSGIHVEYRRLIDSLIALVQDQSGLPLLRVHWYDSAHNGVPDYQQQRIGELAKVKLRLGRVGYEGQQKGVDLRIGLDLVTHARNKTSDVFFLVTGDDDLTEAVEEAQVHGVQVVLLAVPVNGDRPHGVSKHLLRAVDDLQVVDGAIIDDAALKVELDAAPAAAVPAPAVPAPKPGPSPRDLATSRPIATPAKAPAPVLAYTSSTGADSYVAAEYQRTPCEETVPEALTPDLIDRIAEQVVNSFLTSSDENAKAALAHSRPSIPRDLDRALLLDACEAIDVYDLPEQARFRLRNRFWDRHDALSAAGR